MDGLLRLKGQAKTIDLVAGWDFTYHNVLASNTSRKAKTIVLAIVVNNSKNR